MLVLEKQVNSLKAHIFFFKCASFSKIVAPAGPQTVFFLSNVWLLCEIKNAVHIEYTIKYFSSLTATAETLLLADSHLGRGMHQANSSYKER